DRVPLNMLSSPGRRLRRTRLRRPFRPGRSIHCRLPLPRSCVRSVPSGSHWRGAAALPRELSQWSREYRRSSSWPALHWLANVCRSSSRLSHFGYRLTAALTAVVLYHLANGALLTRPYAEPAIIQIALFVPPTEASLGRIDGGPKGSGNQPPCLFDLLLINCV